MAIRFLAIVVFLSISTMTSMSSAQSIKEPTNRTEQQKELPKFSARVQVSVSSGDQISGEITSYINRELRNLHDVIVTDDKPEYRINIVAMENRLTNGVRTGYSLSVIVTTPFDPSVLKLVVALALGQKDEKTSLELQNRITKDTLDYEMIVQHYVQTGGQDDLRGICEKVVASFDGEVLERTRKAHQEVIDKVEELRKKKSP